MPTLYVYISSAHPDLQGAVGWIHRRPGFRYAEFHTGNEVVMVDPDRDLRLFDESNDRVNINP